MLEMLILRCFATVIYAQAPFLRQILKMHRDWCKTVDLRADPNMGIFVANQKPVKYYNIQHQINPG